jgi:hypothetical protein
MIGKNMKVGAAVFALSVGGGLLAGSVLGSPGTSSAASPSVAVVAAAGDSTSTDASTQAAAPNHAPPNPETPLEGDVAAQVTAAAQAAIPDGTIDRVETDRHGVYEARVTKADGTHVIVKIGADYSVTATIDLPQGGPGGHDGGPGAGETPLEGDVATQVTAAAQAAIPDGTIDRVETDNDGVYEAHVTKADGTHVIVQIGADYSVTATIDQPQGGPGGPGGGPGAGETPLEGDAAASVTAAAQAAIPDGTIDRVETDNDGVYEAHVTKADGTHVVVKVDASFAVTGTEEMPAGGPRDGRHQGPPPAGEVPADQPATTTAG